MKKLSFMIAAFIVTCGLVLLVRPFFRSDLKSDQDFIQFAMKAEKRRIAVIFIQNPEVNKEFGLRINSRWDLEQFLAPYWQSGYIDQLWQKGSSTPGLPFGFYTEQDDGLLHAKNIHILSRSWNRVVVGGHVEWMQGDYDRNIVIERTWLGWRAKE